MSPDISFTNTSLGYPIFDAEFDPFNRGFLVVGGGGGEGRSGVKNKLTVLDVSSLSKAEVALELDLGQEEDSIQSLSSLVTADGLITFAGINSSTADREAGKNEHLRSFQVEYPSKKRKVKGDKEKPEERQQKEGKIETLSKTALFNAASAKTRHISQKLMKLSPIRLREGTGTKRLGAIATGLDKGSTPEGEVLLFDATTSSPDKSDICSRIGPKGGAHAEDLDLDEAPDGTFALAFITEEDAYVYKTKYDFTTKKAKPLTGEPTNVFATSDQVSRRRLRCVRWLGPNHILLLQNIPPRDGAELVILDVSKPEDDGQIILIHPLKKSCKLAVGLDVCILDPDPATGDRQMVIAVSSQDYSIHVFVVNFQPGNDAAHQFIGLKAYTRLDEVHSYPITKIAFSKFHAPQQPKGSNMSVASSPQYIRLASVSLANTVVIDTFTLTSRPTQPSDTSEVFAGRKSPSVRWELSSSGSETLRSWFGLTAVGIAVLVLSILGQYYFNMSTSGGNTSLMSKVMEFIQPGTVPQFDGAQNPAGASMDGDFPTVRATQPHRRLRDVLKLRSIARSANRPTGNHAIVVHPHPDTNELTASRHEDEEELKARGAVPFEELPAQEQELWKQKLMDAGHWSADEGETILKGVLISQWAEIVGGAIRDAVLQA